MLFRSHNIVNMKLGKPIVTFREALVYWSERSNYDEIFPIEDTLIVLGLVIAVYFLLIK